MRKGKHRKVFICSPFRPRGNTLKEIQGNRMYNQWLARTACKYAVSHNYMPMAPHLFFPNFLSDADEAEREQGIRLGLEWLGECDELWVIGNFISEGMKKEIRFAEREGIPVIHYVVSDDCHSQCPYERNDRHEHSSFEHSDRYCPDCAECGERGGDGEFDGFGDYDEFEEYEEFEEEEGFLYDGD